MSFRRCCNKTCIEQYFFFIWWSEPGLMKACPPPQPHASYLFENVNPDKLESIYGQFINLFNFPGIELEGSLKIVLPTTEKAVAGVGGKSSDSLALDPTTSSPYSLPIPSPPSAPSTNSLQPLSLLSHAPQFLPLPTPPPQPYCHMLLGSVLPKHSV